MRIVRAGLVFIYEYIKGVHDLKKVKNHCYTCRGRKLRGNSSRFVHPGASQYVRV